MVRFLPFLFLPTGVGSAASPSASEQTGDREDRDHPGRGREIRFGPLDGLFVDLVIETEVEDDPERIAACHSFHGRRELQEITPVDGRGIDRENRVVVVVVDDQKVQNSTDAAADRARTVVDGHGARGTGEAGSVPDAQACGKLEADRGSFDQTEIGGHATDTGLVDREGKGGVFPEMGLEDSKGIDFEGLGVVIPTAGLKLTAVVPDTDVEVLFLVTIGKRGVHDDARDGDRRASTDDGKS